MSSELTRQHLSTLNSSLEDGRAGSAPTLDSVVRAWYDDPTDDQGRPKVRLAEQVQTRRIAAVGKGRKTPQRGARGASKGMWHRSPEDEKALDSAEESPTPSGRSCAKGCCTGVAAWADQDEQPVCMECAENWPRRSASKGDESRRRLRRTPVSPSGSAAAEESRVTRKGSAAGESNHLGINSLSRSSDSGDQGGHPKVVSRLVPLSGSKRMQTQNDNSCTLIAPVWGSALQSQSRSVEPAFELAPRAEGGALSTECIDCACAVLFCSARTRTVRACVRCTCIVGPDICTRNIWAQVDCAL